MARKPPKGKSLAEVNPELAKQWHPTKNGDLTPFDFTNNSGAKVWWKCEKGNDHEWEATIGDRSTGTGCPICSGRKIVLSNCLATLKPDLAKEWHPTKNNDLTPKDVGLGSGEKVWWKCDKADDHIWDTKIKYRSKGSGCPICSGRLVVKSTCLNTTHPEIANQWHSTKNNDLTPYNISRGSDKIVWWKCDKDDDHVWDSTISSRVAGSNCPMCSGNRATHQTSLAMRNPNIAKMWHPTKNGDLTPSKITYKSAKKVWWNCSNDHVFHESILNMERRKIKCRICNSLAEVNPDLASEWHATKNESLSPYEVSFSSGKKFWWKCEKGDDHEWQASIDNRNKGKGCSVCAGLTVVNSNCLATTHPEIAKEWHSTKNGNLTPFDIIAGSHIDIWWKCDTDVNHEWISRSSARVEGNGCPNCAEHGFNPDKLSYFYLRDVELKDKRAIKFGVTNQLTGKRETKQKRGVDGVLETIFRIKIEGYVALSIENKCKKYFGRKGFLTKDEFPDGFTETIKYSEESFNKIKLIVDEVLSEKAEKKK